MKFDKVTGTVIVVCILFVCFWPVFTKKMGWEAPPQPAPTARVSPPEPAPGNATAPVPTPTPAQPALPPELGTPLAGEALAPVPFNAGKLVMDAQVDPAKGGIRNLALTRYSRYDRREGAKQEKAQLEKLKADPRHLEILYRLKGMEVKLLEGDRIQGFAAVVGCNSRDLVPVQLSRGEDGSVRRTSRTDQGFLLEEAWIPDPKEDYGFRYVVVLRNDTAAEATATATIALGTVSMPASTSMFSSNAEMAEIDALSVKDAQPRLCTFDQGKIAKGKAGTADGDTFRWAAIHSKYFIFFLEATGDGRIAKVYGTETKSDSQAEASARLELKADKLAPGGSREWTFKAYAGPKEYQRMAGLGEQTVKMLRMDLFFFWHADWMGALSRWILMALVQLKAWIGGPWGYGVGIVLITLAIKLLFWPLSHKSSVSMFKLQQVQPKIKDLQDKHKDNPALMNQKVMELYKEHDVNPMGGCLPILLQMPIFFALFNTFRAAIELRHAEFLWVQDLAMPDTVLTVLGLPIRPLAIMMGVTMIGQQLMAPKGGDPMQAKMMQIMTLFFVVLLYSMPAGLTLYWTVNQTLSIVQSYFTNRHLNQLKQKAAARA